MTPSEFAITRQMRWHLALRHAKGSAPAPVAATVQPEKSTVTESNLHSEDSSSIDRALMEVAGLLMSERMGICNMETTARFVTYNRSFPKLPAC